MYVSATSTRLSRGMSTPAKRAMMASPQLMSGGLWQFLCTGLQPMVSVPLVGPVEARTKLLALLFCDFCIQLLGGRSRYARRSSLLDLEPTVDAASRRQPSVQP